MVRGAAATALAVGALGRRVHGTFRGGVPGLVSSIFGALTVTATPGTIAGTYP
jgi:hypothetical protein